jgi:hypothetical protein
MWAFQVAMEEGVSEVSRKFKQGADLLLVVELHEVRFGYARTTITENQRQTIIFSTIPLKTVVNIQTFKDRVTLTDLVSPSRSLSLLFSGWIFFVSILGW